MAGFVRDHRVESFLFTSSITTSHSLVSYALPCYIKSPFMGCVLYVRESLWSPKVQFKTPKLTKLLFYKSAK